MKQVFFLLITGLFLQEIALGQIVPSRYFIEFTDKQNSPYSLSQPQEFLSSRAIERRSRHGIPLEENDLPVNPHYIDSILNQGDLNLLHSSRWFNAVTIHTTDSAALLRIRDLPFVKNMTASGKRSTRAGKKEEMKLEEPDYTAKTESSVNNDYGPSFTQINMIDGDYLHESGLTGEGMLIAVMDAGYSGADTMAAFSRLRESNGIIATRDFVDGGENVYRGHSHGTNVLSIMAAWLPGQLIGTAYDADYLLLRTENVNYERRIEEDNWVAAAEFADSAGADVFNTSLGYTTFDDPDQNYSYSDMDGNTTRITIGADIAASKGILVVNSAGNYGNDPWQYIGAPADGHQVLSIGAVDSLRNRAGFSSRGPTFDGRIKPDVAAMGQLTVLATASSVVRGNGTSFSSPLIAGMAACLWQCNPGKSNLEVLNAIRQSGHQAGNPDTLLGYGIPSFESALNLLTGGIFYCSSTEDSVQEDSLAIFPNPFKEAVDIVFYSSEVQQITIELWDLSGRRTFINERKAYLGKNKIEITSLNRSPSGVYLLRITTGGGDTIFGKIVKMDVGH